MRLCSYTVVNDCGFAPNPFGGYCTLAACTPNHQGIRLAAGDWLVGHASAARGHGLIYAMEVAEVLDLDAYYNDPRFARKKPRLDRHWRDACGDNIYHRGADGRWQQDYSLFHRGRDILVQDTRNAIAYIGKEFYYFGSEPGEIPERFAVIIRDRHGCKCSYPERLAQGFVAWLRGNFPPGIRADPRDLDWVQDLDKSLQPSGRPSCFAGVRRQQGGP
jgi:hypothetical protein